jgi:hypothetical protein
MSQAGLIDIEGANPQIPTKFVTDSGNAIPIANTLEILGAGGITTSASGNTVTIDGSGSGSGIETIDGNSGSVTGSTVTLTGGTTGLTFAGVSATMTMSGTLIVANGGTGQTSLTSHSILVGASTSAITQVGPSSTVGSAFISGGSSAPPSFSTTTTISDSGQYLLVSSSNAAGGPQISVNNTNSTPGATARMVIATGGVGTDSDSYMLLEAGSTSSASWEFGNQGSTNNSFVIQSNPSNTHPYMDGTTAFSITPNGQVAIPNNSNVVNALSINLSQTSSYTPTLATTNSMANFSNGIQQTNGYASIQIEARTANGGFAIGYIASVGQNNSNGAMCFGINETEFLRFGSSSGASVVGISTDAGSNYYQMTGQTSTIGANGGASALTVLPVGYITVFINGTQYQIPYYNHA